MGMFLAAEDVQCLALVLLPQAASSRALHTRQLPPLVLSVCSQVI
jgi:hypothetical protein